MFENTFQVFFGPARFSTHSHSRLRMGMSNWPFGSARLLFCFVSTTNCWRPKKILDAFSPFFELWAKKSGKQEMENFLLVVHNLVKWTSFLFKNIILLYFYFYFFNIINCCSTLNFQTHHEKLNCPADPEFTSRLFC